MERQKDGEGIERKWQRADGKQRSDKKRRQIDGKGKKDEKEVKLETTEGTDGCLERMRQDKKKQYTRRVELSFNNKVYKQ